jgi:hypothetical protein
MMASHNSTGGGKDILAKLGFDVVQVDFDACHLLNVT